MHVVATAGHVDHGKSTLVQALTGTDPDRWAEEKARGLTIDLGFAATTLPSGREVGFVDVPGHVRFLKNMLAGVGAVDACLFVVAATEGWKPQSEEHLRILELLGIRHGVVALTKAGDDVADVEADVASRMAGTFLEGAPIVALDSVSGQGLAALVAALDALLADVPPAEDLRRPRLWVDRSFAVRGAGTVATGTLTGGAVSEGDAVVVLPSGHEARVRGLQCHGTGLERASPGRRVALNLAGVGHNDLARGDAVVRPGQWAVARTVDCSLTVLPSLAHDVTGRGAHLAYLGSGEHEVRVQMLGAERSVAPGTTGLVRLHLPVGVPLVPGDRFILRESGRSETVGGGEVLDVEPVLPARRACPDRSVERVVDERGWVDVDELERLTGERLPATVGRWAASASARRHVEAELRAAVDAAGDVGLDVAALDERGRALLGRLDDIEVVVGRARRRGSLDRLTNHPVLVALEAAPFAPPVPDEVDRAMVHELVRHGLVIEQDGVWFAASAVNQATEVIIRLLQMSPGGITVSVVTKALATTRKFALPLLARCDADGLTIRRGNIRIAGKRLLAIDPAKSGRL